jgi:hypothetical protein
MTDDTQPAPRVGFREQVGVHAGAHQDLIILSGRHTFCFCRPKCIPPWILYPHRVSITRGQSIESTRAQGSHSTDWFGTPLTG